MFTTPSRNFPRMIFEITPAGDERSSLKVTKLAKRIFTVLLAGLLTASMAACGNGGDSSSTAEGSSTTSAASGESSTAASSDTGSAGNGEVSHVVVWGTGNADTADCTAVAEAVSAITRDAIGVEVELVRGQDGEQINLALTSGEQIDLLNYNSASGGLPALVRNQYATALDDLLPEYGSEILDVINEEDLAACTIGGVSTNGGVGKVSGVLVGVLVFEVLKICLQFLGVDPAYTYIAQGLVIVIAVALDLRKYLAKK